jgi:uncharacterized protein YjeT (DUF2065 family)
MLQGLLSAPQQNGDGMSQFFLVGVALVLVFEGILPFISPRLWRVAMQQMLIRADNVLRIMGFVSMITGVVLLYWIH